MLDLKRQEELREAIELFYFAYREFTAGPDRILARHGLGRVHHRILYFVARNPGVGVGRLLEILAVTKQALNGPLRQLIEAGLVSAMPAPHDRRSRQLRLTAAGRKLEVQLTSTQMRRLASVFAAIGQENESAWRRAMHLMIHGSDGTRPE